MLEPTSPPRYMTRLMRPNAGKAKSRRVWSIDLETVLLPLFHASNVMGDSAIPSEALGSPIRLAYDKDGTVKFSKSGRPVTKVVKEITQQVTLMRENMVAEMKDYTGNVIEGKAEGFEGKAEAYVMSVKQALKAGSPIMEKDRVELDKAIKAQIEQAILEAEKQAEPIAEPIAEPSKANSKVKVSVS